MKTKPTSEQLAKIERIMHPRNTMVSIRFRRDSVASWKRAAEQKEITLTEWIESRLNGCAEREGAWKF